MLKTEAAAAAVKSRASILPSMLDVPAPFDRAPFSPREWTAYRKARVNIMGVAASGCVFRAS
jgi:hypothetical protein